jgi:hypothetical protein
LQAMAFLAVTARAAPEFIGILTMPGRAHFALTDEPGQPAAWRSIGQEFAGYSLAEYDAKSDTLTLTRQGAPPLRLRLKDDAKIKNARLEVAGALTLGGKEKIEFTRATLLFDQENIFPLKDGLTCRITPSRHTDGNHIYRAVFERRGTDGRIERLASPAVLVKPADEFKIVVGDIEFGFAPKAN